MTPTKQTPARFHFGPLERRGVIAGWQGAQLLTLAAGVIVGIVLLGHHPGLIRIGAALAIVVMSFAAAWWPIGGVSAVEWAPMLTRQFFGIVLRNSRHRDALPTVGRCINGENAICAGNQENGQGTIGAGPFGALTLKSLVLKSGEEIGIVVNKKDRTVTAVVELEGQSFSLLAVSEQNAKISGWAALLSSLSRERSLLHRVGWIAATMPDDGEGVARYFEQNRVLHPTSAPTRSYEELLAQSATQTACHVVVLTVTIRLVGYVERAIKAQGGGTKGLSAIFSQELDALAQNLRAGDVESFTTLDERSLAKLVVAFSETTPRMPNDRPSLSKEACSHCPTLRPWPLVTTTMWSRFRTTNTFHATYWIAEWPRLEVGAEFLAPLLVGSARRRIGVVMEPQPPSRAMRRAEAARTADVADAELRRRAGFLNTARRAREAEVAQRRESELAQGHGAYRFSGYVTLSASDEGELERLCAASEQGAAHARLWLRRLYGRQDWAYLCTLPLGQGVR